MHKFETCGRSMRWYEWLSGLLLLLLACGLRAQPVYKCTGPDGAIAYQDKACGAQQLENELRIDPAPPVQPSPQYFLAHDATQPRSTPSPLPRAGGRRRMWTQDEEKSFECRASNGDVFYRHNACPHSIKAPASGNGHKGASGGVAATLAVSSRPVARSEACAQMRRAGAVGRNGHEHDEDVSTYERNLGHDPCR